MTLYQIVETDNFGGDYPNESFVGTSSAIKAEVQARADELNVDEHQSRYYKVVELPYELQPGFEP